MSELQPSQLLNRQQGWMAYGLSQLDNSIPGENNMSMPGEDPHDPRQEIWVHAARSRFYQSVGLGPNFALAITDPLPTVTTLRGCRFGSESSFVSQLKGDALVTNLPGLALQILYADCCPIILADPEKQAVGLIHAGWQQTLRNITGKTVQALRKSFGSQPGDLKAFLGPTICVEHYPRGNGRQEWELIDAFYDATWVEPVVEERGDKLHCDIAATNFNLLRSLGVRQIEVSPACTYEQIDQPSARRDDPKLNGPFRSNAMAAVMIRP